MALRDLDKELVSLPKASLSYWWSCRKLYWKVSCEQGQWNWAAKNNRSLMGQQWVLFISTLRQRPRTGSRPTQRNRKRICCHFGNGTGRRQPNGGNYPISLRHQGIQTLAVVGAGKPGSTLRLPHGAGCLQTHWFSLISHKQVSLNLLNFTFSWTLFHSFILIGFLCFYLTTYLKFVYWFAILFQGCPNSSGRAGDSMVGQPL